MPLAKPVGSTPVEKHWFRLYADWLEYTSKYQ